MRATWGLRAREAAAPESEACAPEHSHGVVACHCPRRMLRLHAAGRRLHACSFLTARDLCNALAMLRCWEGLSAMWLACAGTGKTLLARAVANRTDACFIRVIGSELVQKYVGEGARMVRELFQARPQPTALPLC